MEVVKGLVTTRSTITTVPVAKGMASTLMTTRLVLVRTAVNSHVMQKVMVDRLHVRRIWFVQVFKHVYDHLAWLDQISQPYLLLGRRLVWHTPHLLVDSWCDIHLTVFEKVCQPNKWGLNPLTRASSNIQVQLVFEVFCDWVTHTLAICQRISDLALTTAQLCHSRQTFLPAQPYKFWHALFIPPSIESLPTLPL